MQQHKVFHKDHRSAPYTRSGVEMQASLAGFKAFQITEHKYFNSKAKDFVTKVQHTKRLTGATKQTCSGL